MVDRIWTSFVGSNGGETAVENILKGADDYQEQIDLLEGMLDEAGIEDSAKRTQLKGDLRQKGWLIPGKIFFSKRIGWLFLFVFQKKRARIIE